MMQRPPLPAMTCHEVRRQLELYLDRTLQPTEDQAVHAHLQVCGTCHAEVALAEAVEMRLRSTFRDEMAPRELWCRITADLSARGGDVANPKRHLPVKRLPRRAAIAATVLLAVGGVLAGRQLMTTRIRPAELMETPVDELRSFFDSGRPVDLTTADPAELRQWFVPRLDFPPPLPPTKAGLMLIGGRLCYFFRRRIAAYMYRVDDHILSLYIMSDEDIEPPLDTGTKLDDRPAAIRESNGFAHVLWRDGRLYYSLVSNQPAARLIEVARKMVIAIA